MVEDKVVLVNTNRMRPVVAPLGLEYLASALTENGLAAEVLDLCFVDDPDSAIASYFAQVQPLLVAVTLRNSDDVCYATQDFFLPGFRRIINQIKRHTAAPVVIGGSGFSVMAEAILDYCDVDWGVWGEGEYALPRLVAQVKEGGRYDEVPGVVGRKAGAVYREPPHYLDLGRFTPRRGAIDNRRYFVEGGMGGVETKRGCPKGCIYCADPLIKGRKLRLRPPQSVLQEIETLIEAGIDHIHFCDSEFNIPERHCRELCQGMVERGLGSKVRWYVYASPVPFSDELAALWLRAGCAGINFGVDVGCDRMLRRLGREFIVADLARTAQICHRHGLIFMYDLLLGGPGEDKESVRETVETMKRLSPHRVGVSLGIRLFPGTRLAAMVGQSGPLAANPNLSGVREGNENFFFPIFYLSAAIGEEAPSYLAHLSGGDQRFFFMAKGGVEQNYNYNDNTALVEAIRSGYRGAFWDILRRVAEGRSKTA